MKFNDQQKKYALLAVGGAVLFLVLWLVFRPPEEAAQDEPLFSTQETTTTTSSSQTQAETDWYVDLKGAVANPGMYRIKEGMRLMDAIEMGGGFTDEADRNQVNLAKLLSDQEIVYVPKVGEEIPVVQEAAQGPAAAAPTEGGGGEEATEKININTADAAQLQQLSGIGEKRAQDIINYREENGSFQSVEDITNVSGIGQKTLENLRNSITI
ncbi:helix-hairpin-helix domain-containing protein [Enterococcus sp. 669A]|uniref:Helix-hairpin-helix domain-containing protein n=1 Tax=Candidatus Enterococcus moelleringii TaxID=2815325 RepID=A0ABS3LE58_9ENTE|nr:helix-hairpin-helix domain-containing protein [Enterococcus sp. 669A]